MSGFLKNRIRAFLDAIKGIIFLLKSEVHFRIHIFLSVVAVGLGCWLSISSMEWVAVLLCIGGVLSLEAVNSSIELLVNMVQPHKHDQAGKIKDVAAAAVLLAACASFLVGVIIFIPKLMLLWMT